MGDIPVRVRLVVLGYIAVGAWLFTMTVSATAWDWVRVVCLIPAAGIDFLRVDLRQYSNGQHRIAFTLDNVSVFLMLGLFGPAWAMLTLALNTLLYGVTKRTPAYKLGFNMAALTLATWLASLLITGTPLPWLAALPLGACVYFLVNTGSITLVISMISRKNPVAVWRENYSWMALQHIVLAAAGFIFGRLTGMVGWWVLLAALPLLMIYRTYSLYAKANEAHLQEYENLSSQLITTLAAVVDARDAYTAGHSSFVARYSLAIAEQLGYSREDLARLHRGALLHDIGKVGIPESILFKNGRLTGDEYDLMKRHSRIGYRIIRQMESLEEIATIALHHHERWNGQGYPDGLAGEEIPLDSRIVAVADALETMLSDRPYRKGSSLTQALTEIERCSGTQFDPAVVLALHAVVALKGREFFVNSAELVQRDHPEWSPAGVAEAAASQR